MKMNLIIVFWKSLESKLQEYVMKKGGGFHLKNSY